MTTEGKLEDYGNIWSSSDTWLFTENAGKITIQNTITNEYLFAASMEEGSPLVLSLKEHEKTNFKKGDLDAESYHTIVLDGNDELFLTASTSTELTLQSTYIPQCGKTQETVKKIELTKDLWNMNDYNVNEWFLK